MRTHDPKAQRKRAPDLEVEQMRLLAALGALALVPLAMAVAILLLSALP